MTIREPAPLLTTAKGHWIPGLLVAQPGMTEGESVALFFIGPSPRTNATTIRAPASLLTTVKGYWLPVFPDGQHGMMEGWKV